MHLFFSVLKCFPSIPFAFSRLYLLSMYLTWRIYIFFWFLLWKKPYHNYCWNQTFSTQCHLRDFLAVYYMKIIVYHLFCHIHLVRPQCCNIFLNYFIGILLYFQKHDLHTAKIQIIALCYLIFSLSGCSAVIGDLLRKQQKP